MSSIDREVYKFIEYLIFLAEDDCSPKSIHRHSNFWQSLTMQEQARHLASVWENIDFHDPQDNGLQFLGGEK
jgi:hypothetical protein